jgi:hypothetical protein
MSKVTVVADANGNIAAIGHGHLSRDTAIKSGDKALLGGLRAGPGQQLHELDLAEDVSQVADFRELHAKVRAHLK